jgi:hypothetical protein
LTRLQATVALLQAWPDFFPWPETWTGNLQRRSTTAGAAPFRSEACQDCQGRGKVRNGVVCLTCKGDGRLWVDGYTGDRVERDPHVETASEFVATFARLVRAQLVACDRCGGTGRSAGWTDGGRGAETYAKPIAWDRDAPVCDVCDGTGRVPGPFTGVVRAELATVSRERSGDRVLDALANGHERRDDQQVYRNHLAPAMTVLKREDPFGHFLVGWVWIAGHQEPRQLERVEQIRLVRATTRLERSLPDPIRLPGEIRQQHANRQRALAAAKGKKADRYAQAERDREIRRLRAQGLTLAEIAARFGLDKSRVSRITAAA